MAAPRDTWADAIPCTLLVDARTGHILVQEGPCAVRNSPASTFKLALALIGYDSGILVDAHSPAWPYHHSYDYWNAAGRKTVDPTSWLEESIVWYSQVLTSKLGKERLESYVQKLHYGNEDISGWGAMKGVLPPAVWVDSTLQISPLEQVAFVRSLVNESFPISQRAYAQTRAVAPTFPLADGWTVHGKTGTGYRPAGHGVPEHQWQYGWFVGWAEKGGRTIAFARLIQHDKVDSGWAGPEARDALLADWPTLLARAAK